MHPLPNKEDKKAWIIILYARVSITETINVDKKADWSTDTDK